MISTKGNSGIIDNKCSRTRVLIARTSSCYGRLNLLNTAIGHIKEIGPSNDISKEAFSVSCHVCNISGREFITPNVHLTHFADKSFISTKVGCHSVLFLSKNKRPSCCDNLENKTKKKPEVTSGTITLPSL